MRADLLGLPLESAVARLEREGVRPEVRVTAAPKGGRDGQGALRVVYASDGGEKLVAAAFLAPPER